MSPSSTEPRAGLFVGRDGVACVLLGGGAENVITLTRTALLDTHIYRGMARPEAQAALDGAVGAVTAELRGRHLAVHVVVPDAAASAATFELDQVPKDGAALGKLVEHRLARELGAPPGACVSQLLGQGEGKYLVLGASMDRGWLAAVKQSLAVAGVVPWSLCTASTAVFNSLDEATRATSGALITLTTDAWALWAWDASGHVRPLRSQWRGSDDEREIAAEVERSLIAYVDAHPSRSIGKLHVWSLGGGDALAAMLDQRTQLPCERQRWPQSLTGLDACADSPALAVSVMAALTP